MKRKTSVVSEKVFNKQSAFFMIKIKKRPGMEGYHFNIMKGNYEKPVFNTM